MTDDGQASPTRYPRLRRVLVVIPTYNEADNVTRIVPRVRLAAPTVDVLIADDNSPDGTGHVADGLAATDPQVRVLHRPGKQGLGAAYLAGFAWARQHGYDAVVEMDADGSHAPEDLPALLHAAGDADVVIGSRWARGASLHGWPLRRLALSRCGNLYARFALGMPVADATGGYRVYRLAALDRLDLSAVRSQGYSFQVEVSRLAHRAGLRMVEVPITFTERQHGTSKMSPAIVGEALWRIGRWGWQDRRTDVRRLLHGTPTGQARWP